jgi:hypothetical protein
LQVDPELGAARATWLRRLAVQASPPAMHEEMDKVVFLRGLGAGEWDLGTLPAKRVAALARWAQTASNQALALGALFDAVPKDRLAAALADCERIARPASNSHVDLLGDHYSRLRQCMPRFLEVLTFCSHRHDDELLEGIDVLKKLNRTRRRNMPPDAPLTFVPRAWMPFVLSGEDNVSRRFWELALLWRLRDGLRSGDV